MREILEYNPVIAAVKSDETFNSAIKSDCEIVFLLYGDILTLRDKVEIIKKNDKKVFIHLDMISGIASNPIIVDYIHENIKVDGIISTKVNIVKRAIEKNINVVQRFFILDSMSLESAMDSIKKVRPSAIEIMPGIMPKVIKRLKDETSIPLIAGGLIKTKEDIMDALKSGAVSVSTTNSKLWEE
ncbi:glycerol-3-phosphate responsive antiterminator [Alkalithermobacter paradoxus]|uniref:Glycerol-3-phosphate responsive antiterminator n=1 Tax=Alkalithermobacter paradoxus TaxID=29349 RepID=A0A1V4I7Z9_9FIRM|nr:glycerol-3-phosphate responsive antiterminator [[Clostridium] thermoalcaliphilum]